MKRSCVRAAWLVIGVVSSPASPAIAQTAGTGAIVGRVIDKATGTALPGANVSVEIARGSISV